MKYRTLGKIGLKVSPICMGAKNIDDYRVAIEGLELPPFTPAIYEKFAECKNKLG